MTDVELPFDGPLDQPARDRIADGISVKVMKCGGMARGQQIAAIAAAQLFCYHVTRAKGLDTESPRGLRKVTLTH